MGWNLIKGKKYLFKQKKLIIILLVLIFKQTSIQSRINPMIIFIWQIASLIINEIKRNKRNKIANKVVLLRDVWER